MRSTARQRAGSLRAWSKTRLETLTRLRSGNDLRLAAFNLALGLVDQPAASPQVLSRLGGIVLTSNRPIYSMEPDTRLSTWNSAAERMFGYAAAQMIGRSARTLVPCDQMSAFDANLDRIRHGKAAVTYESWRLRRDGSRIPVSISLAGIQEPGGSLTGFCAVLRDVTPDGQAEAEAEAAEAVPVVREASAPADADHRRIAQDLNNCVMSRIFSAWLVARAATNIADPEVARRLTRVIEDLGLAISELRTAISTLRGGC